MAMDLRYKKGQTMTVDEAVTQLVEAENLPEFLKLTRYQQILNEVSDAAFFRGQESTLPY
jgi:hypothetical protein